MEKEAEGLARKEKLAAAGGQLFGAAFDFVGEIFSQKEETEESAQMADLFRKRLSGCMEKGEDGRLKMTITPTGESVLNNMAKSLAQVLGSAWKE